MGVEDLDRLSSKYKVKNVLSDTTEKNGRTFVVEMESTHPMSLLTSKLMAVSVQPGSKLDRNGMLMHVVGPNPSLKILYAAAKKWKNISRVSSKNLSIDELGPNEILNPHQFEVLQFAFNNGYYDSPKGCTIQDMANELNLSTTTVKDHLRKAEHQAIGQYFDSMNPNS